MANVTEILRPTGRVNAVWASPPDWRRVAEAVVDPAAGDGLTVEAAQDVGDNGKEQIFALAWPASVEYRDVETLDAKLRIAGDASSVSVRWRIGDAGAWSTPVVFPTPAGWCTATWAGLEIRRVLFGGLQIGITPTLGGGQSFLLDTLYAQATGPALLSGPRWGACSGLRDMLALSTAWQQLCGAADAEEAKKRIHRTYLADARVALERPYIVLWPQELSSTADSGGVQTYLRVEAQTLSMFLVAKDQHPRNPEASGEQFYQFLDALQDDLEAINGFDDFPSIIAIRESGPDHSPLDQPEGDEASADGLWTTMWDVELGL